MVKLSNKAAMLFKETHNDHTHCTKEMRFLSVGLLLTQQTLPWLHRCALAQINRAALLYKEKNVLQILRS